MKKQAPSTIEPHGSVAADLRSSNGAALLITVLILLVVSLLGATIVSLGSRVYRWIVLVFISLAMFGNYYVYDSISPLADVLKEQLGFSDSNIGFLNAIYSIPNIIMVLIGGFIIDRIGTKVSTFIFGALCLLGAVITTLTGTLEVMATGRLIFGLGAESLIVAVTTAIAKWFKGKELSFAFGINLTIARLGSFAALNSPSWAEGYYDSWQAPLLIAVGFGVTCIVGAVMYWILEAKCCRPTVPRGGATEEKPTPALPPAQRGKSGRHRSKRSVRGSLTVL